jgi:histidinol-phosphate aminotransferase
MKKSENIYRTIKRGVQENRAYTLKPLDVPVKLNQNESPFDFPPELKKVVLQRLESLHWNIYPPFVPDELYAKAAAAVGVTSANLLIGNGSNEMISTILASTCESGKTLVIPQPTFTVYNLIATNLNATVKKVMMRDDFFFDVDALASAAAEPGSVTVLCNPNNPTGTWIDRNGIIRIVEASGGLVVVDEAYIQFGGESVIDLTGEYANLVVLRTFSKVFGLAGLRIGMMIGSDELVSQFSKVKLPYNISQFVINTLDVLLDNLDVIDRHRDIILEEKQWLIKQLEEMPELHLYPTAANFVLVKVDDSKALFNALVDRGVLIRDVSSYPMLENHLRISTGDRQANKILVNSLQQILRG